VEASQPFVGQEMLVISCPRPPYKGEGKKKKRCLLEAQNGLVRWSIR